MEKNLYIDASHPNETRVVLKTNGNIEDYEYEGIKNTLIKNNIYLGKVSRVEPSLQAAFIDFGRERHGFLSFNDIQSDYYQIPQSDLEKIKKEEEKEREKLQKESEQQEEKNLNEGNLEIDDPVEKKIDSISVEERYSLIKNLIAFEFWPTSGLVLNKFSKFLILLFLINQLILIFKNSSESKFFLGE